MENIIFSSERVGSNTEPDHYLEDIFFGDALITPRLWLLEHYLDQKSWWSGKASCSVKENIKAPSQCWGNKQNLYLSDDRGIRGTAWRNRGTVLVSACSNLMMSGPKEAAGMWQVCWELTTSVPGKSGSSLDGSECSQLSQVFPGLPEPISYASSQPNCWIWSSMILFELVSGFWMGSECKLQMCPYSCLDIRVEGRIQLWIQILNFRLWCILSVMLITWKVLCLIRKWTLFPFQLPYPWFNLSNISLTKNLSKGKNFKNDRYEWSKNLHCREVPKSSTAIAHLFVSLGVLVQRWVNFHTHTQRSFVVLSMCESYGILSEKKWL